MMKNMQSDKPYSRAARITDKALGKAQSGFFRMLTFLMKQKDIPLYENYSSAASDTFFKGSDGIRNGSGWSAGFACASIIPVLWRCTADGKPDEHGMCLKNAFPTGGYQTFVSKLFTEQKMNTLILSDNAREDGFLIFISVDGAGVSSGTCKKMRAAIVEALKSRGVKAESILGCNISATHCHAALDTLGMSVGVLKKDRFKPYEENGRSVHPEMELTLASRAAQTVLAAFDRMEKGELYFFETGKTSGVNDKLNFGVKVKNTFSCLLFEGESGEKTLLTNIGAHPTSYGAWQKNSMMCADYPYFMSLALRQEGYNLVFTQSAQASVSGPFVSFDESDERYMAAQRLVKERRLSKHDWQRLYGAQYAEKWYDSLSPSLEEHMKKGAMLAQFLISEIDKSNRVAPVLSVRNTESLIPLDFGVMELACTSGLLGTNVVRTQLSHSGYGVMAETNYIEIGDGLVLLTAPGELSPAIAFGTDPNYTGHSLWNGKTSWSGKEWQYDSLADTVYKKTGKKLILLGITNNELGYIYPDICTPSSLLGTLLFYRENPGDMSNCMLLTPGTVCGSFLTEQYIKLLSE
ncbi:MAG: hypothetical protein MJ177_10340 [Clostridia bacterium]|nr:hypothetical protein [Clostridia bacterium]